MSLQSKRHETKLEYYVLKVNYVIRYHYIHIDAVFRGDCY